MKYRKKPIIIEALQWLGTEKSKNEICKFGCTPIRCDLKEKELILNTLEGMHIASYGDFIIKGIKGEFYPCKPDIFKATYELEVAE